MSEATERERAALIAALNRISMFCDFRPVATNDQRDHLLAAIDSIASLALLKAGVVDLHS